MADFVKVVEAGSEEEENEVGAIPRTEVTEEEWQKIKELRESLGERTADQRKYLSYHVLLRFLRARDCKIPDALTMLEKHLKWREIWKPEEITQESFKSGMESGCWRMIANAKNGYPAILIDLNLWNPHEMTIDEYVRMVSYFEQNALINGSPGMHQIYVVFDMGGWALWHAAYLSYIQQLINVAQDQYPERLAGIFLVNAPFIFRTTWTLISPIVNVKTRAKVQFIVEKSTLLEIFNEEDLPVAVGGSKVTPYPCPNIKGLPNVVEKAHSAP